MLQAPPSGGTFAGFLPRASPAPPAVLLTPGRGFSLTDISHMASACAVLGHTVGSVAHITPFLPASLLHDGIFAETTPPLYQPDALMAGLARGGFALLLHEIDAEEQEGKEPSPATQQQQVAAKGVEPSTLVSLAWGLHKCGRCQPVLLDAIALLLPIPRLSELAPSEALQLLEACQGAASQQPSSRGEASGARQLIEGLALSVAAGVHRYDAWQASQAAVRFAALQYFDDRLMRCAACST